MTTADDFCRKAVSLLEWIDKRTVSKDNGDVLPRTLLGKFRQLANALWQARYEALFDADDPTFSAEMEEGYRAFADAVGFDNDLSPVRPDNVSIVRQMREQGNLTFPSWAIHDQDELAYNPTRVGTIKRALELIADCVVEKPAGKRKKPKQANPSAPRNENADEQIIAALCQIHKYENGSVGNSEPAAEGDIAKAAGVVKGTVSKYFKRTEFFKSYRGYCRSCRNKQIGFHLKMLNREFSELATVDPSRINDRPATD